MANDPDACLPGPLKDFVFDLHDSARRSQLPAEQSTLYNGTYRDLTSKYFASGPWPSPRSVSSECGGDELFLALYGEMTQRHLHSVTRPQVGDRIEGWRVYVRLFDLLLSEVEGGKAGDGLFLLPEWSFDICHEFVYQFQGFCQFRTATFAAAAKCSNGGGGGGSGGGGSGGGGRTPPAHVTESLEALGRNRDAWAVESVLSYLSRLVKAGTGPDCGNVGTAYRYLGLFASVALSRLECLLGDYTASLAALSPVTDRTVPPIRTGGPDSEVRTPEEAVHAVVPARLSMSYHAGVSYLMLRRYRDATRTLSTMCAYVQRGFKTGQLRSGPHSDQYGRQHDRMIALLAVLTHVCPPTPGLLEDSVMKVVRDKYASQLSKIEAGEEGYEDLFIFACPKFVGPAVPDYSRVSTVLADPSSSTAAAAAGDVGSSVQTGQDAYRLQVRQFMSEMSVQTTLRKLRSYMKLYTSIPVAKLAAFNDSQEEDFRPLLLCCKHKMRQLERDPTASSTSSSAESTSDPSPEAEPTQSTPPPEAGGPAGGTYKSALDVRYYVSDGMVHVEEAERQRRFENYFVGQIEQNCEILRDAENIVTEV